MLRELVAAAGERSFLALSGGLPPPEAFPVEALRAAAARVLDAGALQYAPTEGDPALLALIGAPNALVTTGSQQALDLLAKVLLDPGDVAVVESPAYVGALRALAAYEPRFVGVPVDADGMDTARLEALLVGGLRPKLCYVVANFSNPSGATLAFERRVHLAALSERYGFVVIEDDPYAALRFSGDDVPTIASCGGNVVYLGSYSKVIAPGLRVGYAIAPEWLARPLAIAKQATDLTSSSVDQRLVAELVRDTMWFDAHVARLCELYAKRAAALVGSLDDRLAASMPAGGMFVWASITVPGIDAQALTAACMAQDVAIVPGMEFAVDGGFEREVRLSFSQLRVDDLAEAGRRIGSAFDVLG